MPFLNGLLGLLDPTSKTFNFDTHFDTHFDYNFFGLKLDICLKMFYCSRLEINLESKHRNQVDLELETKTDIKLQIKNDIKL
jgi:hypothetical protein